MTDLLYLFIFFLVLSGLVAAADWMRRKLQWPSESTRKFVHVIVGIVVSATPFVLDSMWPMIVLGLLFAGADYLGVKKNWFRGMHGTDRYSLGTVYYPLSFVLLVILFWDHNKLVLVIAMLIMAISDALAAIVGEKYGHAFYLSNGLEKKSWPGSLTMLFSTIIIVLAGLLLGHDIINSNLPLVQMIIIAVIVGFVAAASEIVSLQGSDNLTVPLGSAFVLGYLLQNPGQMNVFAVGMILSMGIAIVSYHVRFLTASGAVGAFLLGTLVYGMGGWLFTVPILTFFILSSIISQVGKKRKQKLVNIFEKSGERDIWQVIANGGIPGILVIIWGFSHSDVWFLMYVAALAAVMADTWGTELGVLSNHDPVSVLDFKPVPMGTSGGITLAGTLGGALGACILIGSAWLVAGNHHLIVTGMKEFVVILLSAVFASYMDSLLGATLQAKYQCPVCNKITEKKTHCDNNETHMVHGHKWMNNDLVNVLCAVIGTLIVLVYWLIVR